MEVVVSEKRAADAYSHQYDEDFEEDRASRYHDIELQDIPYSDGGPGVEELEDDEIRNKRLKARSIKKQPKSTLIPNRLVRFYLIYTGLVTVLLLILIILGLSMSSGSDDDDDPFQSTIFYLPPLFPSKAIYVDNLSPSTDSFCATLAAANLYKGTASMGGEPNLEIEYVIKEFGLPESPQYFDLVDSESTQNVVLLDHNQKSQSPPYTLSPSFTNSIYGVIDTHGIQESGFVDHEFPIPVDIRPWGSTSSIIYFHYNSLRKDPSTKIAQCLVSGILSDTIGLKGPTTTPEDEMAVHRLNRIAKVNLDELTRDLIKSRDPPPTTPAEEVLDMDTKTYELYWADDTPALVRWATYEGDNPNSILSRKEEFVEEMKRLKQEDGYDFFFFSVVDQLQFLDDTDGDISWLLLPSQDEMDLATAVFGEDQETDKQVLEVSPLVSRTLEFIPEIDQYLRSNVVDVDSTG